MKTLKNKKTTIDVSKDSTEKTTFADLAKACINNVPQTGLDVLQMKARLDVMKKIDSSNGEIKLENAEADTLKECAKSMRWILLHEDVVDFLESVEKL